jgi:dienelactone hydrolase
VRLVATFAAALAFAAPVAMGGTFPRFPRTCSRADFLSGEVRVRSEFCHAGQSNAPAVIVLHGCGGFSTFDHRLATSLPSYGFATLDIDYFARTRPPNRKGFCRHGGDPLRALATWISVVDDAHAKLLALHVKSVGIAGWSLGGDLAVAAAAGPGSPGFAALAVFSGGPMSPTLPVATMPPTMLLFGGRTDRDIIGQTRAFQHALRAARVPLAVYVYPDGTHQWSQHQGTVGIERAASFLRAFLH